MTRILLTGVSGQLGQELLQLLSPTDDVIAVGRDQMDLAAPDTIHTIIDQHQPDIIVNAAAYTAVDRAETEAALAHRINATAPQIMAESAQQIGAALIHVSTDYVFDGQKNTPYRENDSTQPMCTYGQSKLAGEEAVRTLCDRSLILRTAWVYSAFGKGNFVKTMLRLGRERDELKVVMDQVGTPTWAKHIAAAIVQLLPKVSDEAIAGTYHFTSSGVASWYDFALAIFEEAQQLGFPLRVKHVRPITTAEFPTPAQRPAYSVLSNQKLISVLGQPAPHWRDGLRQMLIQLYKQTHESTHPLRR